MKNDVLKPHFKEWLGLQPTLDMAYDVSYAHGDPVHYTEADELDPEDDALGRILWAAYCAGALGMAIHLGVEIK